MAAYCTGASRCKPAAQMCLMLESERKRQRMMGRDVKQRLVQRNKFRGARIEDGLKLNNREEEVKWAKGKDGDVQIKKRQRVQSLDTNMIGAGAY